MVRTPATDYVLLIAVGSFIVYSLKLLTAGGYETWKKGFFFAAIPIIILGHVNAFGMADESAHAAPEFVPYDHLRIRSKVPGWIRWHKLAHKVDLKGETCCLFFQHQVK